MRRLVVLLGVVALAGCGDGDTAEPPRASAEPATPTATPTPTATATATAPEATATGDALGPPPSETTPRDQVATIATAEGESLGFTQDRVEVPPGKLTFEMINSGSIPHALALRGKGVNVQGALAEPGLKSTIEIAVKPGTYRFYCPVPGHADGGMVGQLVVR